MSTARTATLLRHLHQWAAGRDDDPQSDRELLRRFTAARDEAAFAVLIRRHGPMVLSVCRRILSRPQDVEDAFQAAFLVLIRKANSSRWRDSVGGWLHRVAARIALRIRADAARRGAEVRRREEGVVVDPLEQMTARELLAAFDEELARLPERYREPLVLCHLAGQTQEETARQLRVSLSSVRRRLERGRQLLHGRLMRRGLALPAALGISAAVVPAPLRAAAMQAIHGGVSARVAALAEGVLQAAVLTPMKLTVAVLLTLGVLAGAGLVALHLPAVKPAEDQPRASAPPDKPKSEKAERVDLYGDPLPPGALLRMGTVRFRHNSFLGSVAFSPDGKILAAGGYFGGILLYDTATGRKLRQLRAFTMEVPALAFAPDGKTLASADSTASAIQIWDAATGKELRRFGAKASRPARGDYGQASVPLVYSRDGKALACVTADYSIHLWDANTGKEQVKLSGHQEPLRCLAFSPDGKLFYSASGDSVKAGSVRVWEVGTGKEVRKFSLHRSNTPGQPTPLCFSPDGKTLVFAAHETMRRKKGKAILNLVGEMTSFLDLTTGEARHRLELQEGRFKSAVFSPDGKLLATMNGVRTVVDNLQSEDVNRIQVWDAATGKRLFDCTADAERFGLHGTNLLAFSADGKKLTAATWSASLHIWDLERGREHLEKPEAHNDLIQCVAYSPDGRTLATVSSDYTIALWDAATGRQVRRFRGHKGPVISLYFSPDGKHLASASDFSDQSVRLWDAATGKELRHYPIPSVPNGDGQSFSGVGTYVTFAANGKLLAAAGTDRKLRLWDVATEKATRDAPVRGLRLPSGNPNDVSNWVRGVTFTADGRTLALFAGKTVRIVDVAAGQVLFQLPMETPTEVLALSPDGKTLLCNTTNIPDHPIQLREVASGAYLHKVKLKESMIYGAAFSPDGHTVAVSAGENGATIYLFDVATGAELLRLRGHDARVRSLAFSPDGTKLASGQWDSTALIWDVSAVRRKLPVKDLTPRDLNRLWADLRDADAAKARAALWALAAAPEKSVPFLKEHLHPMPRVAAGQLRRLLADLDADEFASREEASRELTKLGTEVEPALRRILEDKPSLEVRRRVEALLSELPCQTAMTPDALRQLRATQALEQIGSAEARRILTSLAEGAPAAPATRDAKAALARMAGRP